ncbi:MAG: WYL domain-containing protein [Alistipes sp.]|nr:WYL domain-containing protein [Alistipes sp.]
MSTAGLINRYVWFVTTIYNRGPISLADLQRRFESHFGRGEELSERQFHRYTDAVEELFDIEIKYSRSQRGYVIANREGIADMSMRKWLLQTFSVNNILHQSQELKNRILLEDVPSGQQHLTTIVDAMRENVALSVTYQSFGKSEPSTFEVEPYCVKLFKQRWYMLGKSDGYDELRIYALDRIEALRPTERKFKLPKRFDASKFFEDYYGVIVSDEEFDVCPVALKVDSWQSKYLRTLPLHHSQVEVERNEEYSIFEYRLCPSFDFQQKLLSMGDSVGVLSPVLLKDILRKKAETTANNNASAGMGSQYHFKVYKK